MHFWWPYDFAGDGWPQDTWTFVGFLIEINVLRAIHILYVGYNFLPCVEGKEMGVQTEQSNFLDIHRARFQAPSSELYTKVPHENGI